MKREFTWSPAALEALKEPLRQGLTMSQIALCLSEKFRTVFTRNQIAGVIERYKLKGLRPAALPAKTKPIRKTQPSRPYIRRSPGPGTGTVTITKQRNVPTISGMSRIIDQRVHDYATCKWIDGDPRGEHSVCKQPAAINREGNAKPYCPHHCSIAYVPVQSRRYSSVEA